MRLSVFPQDKKKYLDTIHSYMEVHGTVHGTSTVHLPSYVKNHGILSGRDLQFLLRETKVSPPPAGWKRCVTLGNLSVHEFDESERETLRSPRGSCCSARSGRKRKRVKKKNKKNMYKNYARK